MSLERSSLGKKSLFSFSWPFLYIYQLWMCKDARAEEEEGGRPLIKVLKSLGDQEAAA